MASSRDPPSNILLLLITHLPPTFPLTNDFLFSTFQSFGPIKKILIFERGKCNKAFVEFTNKKSAIKAREQKNFTWLDKCGGK